MNCKPLMLGLLIALAGSSGLKAQGWTITFGPYFGQNYQLQDLPPLVLETFIFPNGVVAYPVTVSASLSRPWHGDPVLESFAVNNTTLSMLIYPPAPGGNNSVTFAGPVTLSRWELKGRNGESLTEKAELSATVNGMD